MKRNILLILAAAFAVFGIYRCSTKEDRYFEQTKKTSSINAYEKYLTEYATGKYKKETFDSILSICEQQMDDILSIYQISQRDYATPYLKSKLYDIMYSKTLHKNTIEEWNHYKQIVGEADCRDANQRISELEKQYLGTETNAWNMAKKLNSIDGYEKYLSYYPNGANSKTARKNIIDLQVLHDFTGEHGMLPAMDRASGRTGTTSYIKIKNRTIYTLRILYSGTEASKSIDISALSENKINLPSGSYKISAKALNGRVIPYVGSENLDGDYSVEYYIETTRY